MGQNGSCHQSGLQVIQVKGTNPKCTQRQVLKNFLKNTELFNEYWSQLQKYEILGQQLVAKASNQGNLKAFLIAKVPNDEDVIMENENDNLDWAAEPVVNEVEASETPEPTTNPEEMWKKKYQDLQKEMNVIKEERDELKKELETIKKNTRHRLHKSPSLDKC